SLREVRSSGGRPIKKAERSARRASDARHLYRIALPVLPAELRQNSLAPINFSRRFTRMNADLKGFLPVDAVVVDGRPGLQWMDMSGVSLAEPLFQQTVERLSADTQFTEFG